MLLATVVAICPRCRGHRTGRCALALSRNSTRGAAGGGARGAAVQLLMGLYSLIPPLRSLTGTPWDRRRPRDPELGAGRVPRAGPWCRVACRAARDPHLAGERSVARAWAGSPALQLMGSEPAGRSEGLDQRRAAIEAQPGCEPVLQPGGEAGGLTARAGQPWSAPRPSQAHTTNKDTPCAHGGPGSHAERARSDQRPSFGPFAHDAGDPRLRGRRDRGCPAGKRREEGGDGREMRER